ncbi:MAG: helix-turn-helix transcriptional regulator [Sphingorhabdus sp.]
MHQNYIDFYASTYPQFLKEVRLIGGDNPIGMFEARQPPGDFPDEALPTYNLQLNIGLQCNALADLGLGQNWIKLANGDFCVAPPETAAAYDVVTPSHLLCLGLPKAIVDHAAAYLGLNDFTPEALLLSGHNDPVVRKLMQECWDQGKHDSPCGALYLDANLMGIAVRLVAIATKAKRVVAPRQANHLTAQSLDTIAQYVDNNIDTDMRVATLASLIGMQDYAFAREFRALTGQPPHQWVIERRLARAAQMLADGALSIAEIAYAVGFSSQAHLTTLFSRRMDMGPAAYRRMMLA